LFKIPPLLSDIMVGIIGKGKKKEKVLKSRKQKTGDRGLPAYGGTEDR